MDPNHSVTVAVTGYDPSLPKDEVEILLREHFFPCGQITEVYQSQSHKKYGIPRYAFIYIEGEEAEERALQLNGSDLGGHNLHVKVMVMPVTESYQGPYELCQWYARKSLAEAEEDEDEDARKMVVTGYDTLLSEDEVKRLLREHFSSCGEITKVYIPTRVDIQCRNKYAFLDIKGEDAEEKALQLNGSDLRGCNLRVKVMTPSSEVYQTTPELYVRKAELEEEKEIRKHTRKMVVTGYDPSLPDDHIKSLLREHFSSCGEITQVYIPTRVGIQSHNKYAFLDIKGEDAEEKALQLNGSYLGESKLLVKVMPPSSLLCRGTPELYVHKVEALEEARKTPCLNLVLVSGFATSLNKYSVRDRLRKYFSICGEIKDVFVYRNRENSGLHKTAMIQIWGLRDEVGEKSWALNGKDMGGWNAEVRRFLEPQEIDFHDVYG